MIKNNEARAVIVAEILACGGRVTLATPSYRMLYKLAKVKGIDINSKSSKIAKICGVKKAFIKRKAKQIMANYIKTGQLVIPREFQIKGVINDG